MIDNHVHAHPEHNPIERVKKELKSVHVDEAIIIPWVRYKELSEEFQQANDYVLNCAQDTKYKFHPFCSVSRYLKLPSNVSKFEGIKWHCLHDPSMFYTSWHDKELDSIVKQIQDTGLPLLIEDELEFIPQLVKKVGKDTKIIIPHMGIYPHANGYPQDLFEFWDKMRPYKNVIFDSALADPELIKKGLKTFGKERVRYGSDSPFGTMRFELENWLEAIK